MAAEAARREGYLNENYRFFHLRDTEGQERDYHFHEFDKLVILLAGRVRYEVETSAYDLRPWDLLLVRHHAIHKATIDVSTPYDRIILYIDGRYVDRLAPGAGLMACFDRADRPGGHLVTPGEEDRPGLAALLSELEASMSDEAFGAEVLRSAALVRLLVGVGRAQAARGAPPAGAPPGRGDRLGPVLSYIQEHLDADLSVERLAARTYLSRYHFMRLFREQTGLSVHAYIRQKRLLRAAERIRGGVPAATAAVECGFGDYSAFYRAFRECFGASPRDIRTGVGGPD